MTAIEPQHERSAKVTFICLLAALSLSTVNVSAASGGLALVDRCVTQDQGAWVVDYRLRNTDKTGVIIPSEEIAISVEGWVSNSRVASHALPRWSSLVVSPGRELAATSEVIAAIDEGHRCRERLIVSIWPETQQPVQPSLVDQPSTTVRTSPISTALAAEPATMLPLSLGPGAVVKIRLRLEHHHILYGEYDLLLAVRAVTLALGAAPVKDVIFLDREHYLAQPRFTWAEPPTERRDTHHFVSGPDSLHLEAHVPGHQYYRYPERPVRYSTKMRLRFWYLIAAGTEGECKVKVGQYKETPISWRQLGAGGFEQCLKTTGRWAKVDRVIQTESEATTLTLEFKIVGETDVGEMWIDNVSLEPVDSDALAGP